jgi:hypothetical protein
VEVTDRAEARMRADSMALGVPAETGSLGEQISTQKRLTGHTDRNSIDPRCQCVPEGAMIAVIAVTVRKFSSWGSLLLVGLVFALPLSARANCAMPVTYAPTVSGQTVKICLWNFAQRVCPDEGLLRRDKSSNQVVKITQCDGSCFLDTCAPPGSYEYGLLEPYTCVSSACSTDWFKVVTVSAPEQPVACSSSAVPYTGSVPWGANEAICVYGGKPPPDPTGGGGGGSVGGGGGGNVGGGGGRGPEDPREPSGCGSSGGSVLALNGLVLLGGLFFWRLRRASRKA